MDAVVDRSIVRPVGGWGVVRRGMVGKPLLEWSGPGPNRWPPACKAAMEQPSHAGRAGTAVA